MNYLAILIFTFLCWSCNKRSSIVFQQEYFMLSATANMHKISQSHDTLNLYNCYYWQPCDSIPSGSFKILKIDEKENQYVLRMKTILSSFTMAKDSEKNYSIAVFRILDSNRIGLTDWINLLSKPAIENKFVDSFDLGEKFTITYYNSTSVNAFKKMNRIKTKTDVEKIMQMIKYPEFNKIQELYSKSNLKSGYNTVLINELLQRACIKLNYNPLAASDTISKIMKKEKL